MLSRSNRFTSLAVLAIATVFLIAAGQEAVARTARASIEHHLPAGSYVPFFPPRGPRPGDSQELVRAPVAVASFFLDDHPVTNGEYLEFLIRRREWRRSAIPKIFADSSYLKDWRSDLELGPKVKRDQPVIRVSWFAATAYCQDQDKELPTTDQWEYAAADAGRDPEGIKARILKWYSSPNPKVLPKVLKTPPNGFGVHDIYDLVWEWTQDFSGAISSAEARADGTKDENLFCGAGSLAALDATDYAKFMRYSFRSSLRAEYTTANLGFRCARE